LGWNSGKSSHFRSTEKSKADVLSAADISHSGLGVQEAYEVHLQWQGSHALSKQERKCVRPGIFIFNFSFVFKKQVDLVFF
jgi:hypothetical protein